MFAPTPCARISCSPVPERLFGKEEMEGKVRPGRIGPRRMLRGPGRVFRIIEVVCSTRKGLFKGKRVVCLSRQGEGGIKEGCVRDKEELGATRYDRFLEFVRSNVITRRENRIYIEIRVRKGCRMGQPRRG